MPDEIKAARQEGDKVQLIPFGSFVVRDRKKREGRNPKTGAKLIIAAGPTEPNPVDAVLGQRRLLNAQVSHA